MTTQTVNKACHQCHELEGSEKLRSEQEKLFSVPLRIENLLLIREQLQGQSAVVFVHTLVDLMGGQTSRNFL
mgnify:CR=1 FL=1